MLYTLQLSHWDIYCTNLLPGYYKSPQIPSTLSRLAINYTHSNLTKINMQFSKLHLVLSLLPSTLAQYGGGSGSSSTSVASASAPTTSSFTPSNVKIIDVGENGLTFSPNTTTADIGDTIEFHFYPPQHSVAQSSFDSPCVPLNNGTGFWSGGFSTDSGENNNVFSVLINDTNPIWFYCAAPTHCQNGMAGVINPP